MKNTKADTYRLQEMAKQLRSDYAVTEEELNEQIKKSEN